MNLPIYGWLFQKLDISNPAGFFLRHKLGELGLPAKAVSERIGIAPRMMDELLYGESSGALYASRFQPRISELIIKQETARPELVPILDQMLYAPRARALRSGLPLLMDHARSPSSDMAPAQKFDLAAKRKNNRVYLDAMWLFGEAVWLAAGMYRKQMAFDRQIALRRRFGSMVAEVEKHPGRDMAFSGEALAMARKGDLWGAINMAADKLETFSVLGASNSRWPCSRPSGDHHTIH